ncbi:MAG: hypothetical protein K9K38_08925 [Rhodoferax sp.]|nr:hypothetical protein [Rhodoferax sp.]MCF8209511.1 hypothetical protein [Rhodoferax sp.]
MTTPLQKWRFFRAGGFDQVRLDSADEILALASLDQKLWVALACPVRGIEFDARTLALVDHDADGTVRAPELLAALQWASERLSDTEVLVKQLPGVPLHAIRGDDDTGRRILAAAQQVLLDTGRSDNMVSVEDASHAQGRSVERAMAAWEASAIDARPLGDATEAAQAALSAVAEKVDDYFVRCRLAAFDARATEALNAAPDAFAVLGHTTLQTGSDGIAALPLARVEASSALPLGAGINPAWADRIGQLHARVVTPLLGPLEQLTEAQWQDLQQRLAAFVTWQASKPDPAAVGDGVRELEQLARYVRDLQLLANNFVSFRNFYTREGAATFQVGTLYLDGRSCELCVAVNDPARHAALAALSRICLVYVDCTRGSEKMAVAAAFTAGDSDQLMVGRNGVFYDRQGRDWNATISRIIDNPISLRQAFWSPYKRLVRLVSDQAQKMASSKHAESESRLSAVATEGSKKVTAAAPSKPAATSVAPFDVAKFAGIFAAIGLAIGAIGTLLASLVTGLFALKWWQLPLALGGLMLLISAPAVILAWFKLRSRNLGPILDANGWAINARARINIPFGTSLTQLAELPAGSERSLIDPYAETRSPWGWVVGLAVLVGLAIAWAS